MRPLYAENTVPVVFVFVVKMIISFTYKFTNFDAEALNLPSLFFSKLLRTVTSDFIVSRETIKIKRNKLPKGKMY